MQSHCGAGLHYFFFRHFFIKKNIIDLLDKLMFMLYNANRIYFFHILEERIRSIK